MKEVASGGGRTVLFVSHNMAAVATLCSRAVLLANGKVAADGAVADVVQQYLIPAGSGPKGGDLFGAPGRSPNFRPCFRTLTILDANREPAAALLPGAAVKLRMDLVLASALRSPRVGVGVNNARGERVFALATYLSPKPIERVDHEATIEVDFKLPPLYPGTYTLDISLSAEDGPFMDQVESAGSFEVLQDGFLGSSHPYFPEMGMVLVPSAWTVARA
ncbi:MAG: Wzt carbohydrate-binding domain-containing protein [Burkholderiaceae bacterium]